MISIKNFDEDLGTAGKNDLWIIFLFIEILRFYRNVFDSYVYIKQQ